MLTETFAYLEMFKKQKHVISEADEDNISLEEIFTKVLLKEFLMIWKNENNMIKKKALLY